MTYIKYTFIEALSTNFVSLPASLILEAAVIVRKQIDKF